MKKILLSIMIVAASVVTTNAQTPRSSASSKVTINTTIPDAPANQVSPNDKVLQNDEQVILRDGKAMLQKNGIMTPLQGRVVTGNGDLITQDGVVLRSNGKKEQLKEAQIISVDGTVK